MNEMGMWNAVALLGFFALIGFCAWVFAKYVLNDWEEKIND